MKKLRELNEKHSALAAITLPVQAASSAVQYIPHTYRPEAMPLQSSLRSPMGKITFGLKVAASSGVIAA